MFTSCSQEIRHLARIVSRDARSTVFKNVRLIEEMSGLSPWDYSIWRILRKIENATVPVGNKWRMTFLVKLLDMRRKESAQMEDTNQLDLMINSLCNT